MPHEIALGDVYFSPLLLVVILAFFASSITAIILNKLRISQFMMNPPLSFLAIMTLYIILIDTYYIQF